MAAVAVAVPVQRARLATSAQVPMVDGCQGCGACLLTCPEAAFRPVAPMRPATAAGNRGCAELIVRADLCTGCGECIEVCPVDAIYFPGEAR